MKTTIRLKAQQGKVFVNVRTLRYVTCNIYTKPEFEKDWVQIDMKDLKQFIADKKAQLENPVVTDETTEAKTE